MTFIVLFY